MELLKIFVIVLGVIGGYCLVIWIRSVLVDLTFKLLPLKKSEGLTSCDLEIADVGQIRRYQLKRVGSKVMIKRTLTSMDDKIQMSCKKYDSDILDTIKGICESYECEKWDQIEMSTDNTINPYKVIIAYGEVKYGIFHFTIMPERYVEMFGQLEDKIKLVIALDE